MVQSSLYRGFLNTFLVCAFPSPSLMTLNALIPFLAAQKYIRLAIDERHLAYRALWSNFHPSHLHIQTSSGVREIYHEGGPVDVPETSQTAGLLPYGPFVHCCRLLQLIATRCLARTSSRSLDLGPTHVARCDLGLLSVWPCRAEACLMSLK